MGGAPHALGLAIPLVIAISTERAAKAGVLIKDRLALERMRTIDVVLFDKTGTLTEGAHAVTGAAPVPGTSKGELIEGTSEPDTIHGLGGNDTIRSRAGGDTVFGGGFLFLTLQVFTAGILILAANTAYFGYSGATSKFVDAAAWLGRAAVWFEEIGDTVLEARVVRDGEERRLVVLG